MGTRDPALRREYRMTRSERLVMSLRLANAWLSCGARAQPRFRRGPPARRQLKPVVMRPARRVLGFTSQPYEHSSGLTLQELTQGIRGGPVRTAPSLLPPAQAVHAQRPY